MLGVDLLLGMAYCSITINNSKRITASPSDDWQVVTSNSTFESFIIVSG
jgi:hypothetical protein